MAKKIYVTEEELDDILNGIKAQLKNMKCYGSVNIKHSTKSDERRAVLAFTPIAWTKMSALVAQFDTEIQWHGLIRRLSDYEFEVYDIIVPPHEVSATTVVSDQAQYNQWLNELPDDIFSDLRFHGHSHVNMTVTPSGTDDKYRSDLVTQLPKPKSDDDDAFYVFMIMNKRHLWSAEIYDLKYNALYKTDEIYLEILVDAEGGTLNDFITEARSLATSRPVQSWQNTAQKSAATQTSPTPAAQKTQKETKNKSEKKEEASSASNPYRGCYGGYDSWDEYYEARYGEHYRS